MKTHILDLIIGLFVIILGFSLLFVMIFSIYLGVSSIEPNKTIINTPKDYTTLTNENIYYWLTYFDIKEKDIVFSQIQLETGYLQSRICKENNNIIGLYDGSNYYKFSHWIESVVFYKYRIQNRLKPNENYYIFLNRIKYAKDKWYLNKIKYINDKR